MKKGIGVVDNINDNLTTGEVKIMKKVVKDEREPEAKENELKKQKPKHFVIQPDKMKHKIRTT